MRVYFLVVFKISEMNNIKLSNFEKNNFEIWYENFKSYCNFISIETELQKAYFHMKANLIPKKVSQVKLKRF